ncbi:pyridoxamine 5'-phosphate oxidase family protein [Streptomyces cacaoi]|uniref:pyridoxamine 5'-phosphate oxidase family protein n=1 Tax=Streptomyces cacaoi TaxID=1898 RepID=UPI003749BE28
MSKPPLPPEAVELLGRPNPCVMATLRSDGAPVSTPTWYVWEDGRVLISLDEGRVRSRVSAWIEIDRWHGWGALKDSDQASP